MKPNALFRRLAGFSGLQILSAFAPLALLPILARAAGVDGWASIIAGQAVGTLVASVATYGWSVVGPALVAGADPAGRWDGYRSSLASRAALLLVALPVGCLVAWRVAADGFVMLTILMACTQSLGALSPAWYAIGVGSPRMILRYDAGPRLLSVLLSAAAILAGVAIWSYPALVLVATLWGAGAATRRLRAEAPADRPRYQPREAWHDVVSVIRTQASAAGSQIAGATYGGATVAIVGLFATTAATAELASGDKLYRFGLMAVVAVGNTFQGWVAEVPYPQSRRRMSSSLLALAALGLAGAVGLTALGPWATGFLFGSDLSVTTATAAFYGLAFLSICLSTSLGRHILVPLGLPRYLLVATVGAAVVGIPGMALLAHRYGAAGGAAGYAASELTMALVLAVLLLRVARRRAAVPEGTSA